MFYRRRWRGSGATGRIRSDERYGDITLTSILSLPLSSARAILGAMIPLPKPRGFWDYAIFALMMTGALVFLFWLEASDGIGWADAVLACAAAVLLVFAIILARRGEKARWIAQPTWHAYVLAPLGAFALMFGAIYADGYLLHRTDITSNRLWHDMVLAIGLTAGTLWSSRRRHPARRQLL
jgi:hypothetical protein